MSAPAEVLTVAQSDAIRRKVERIADDVGLVIADRDRLRLAHHLAVDSLAALRGAMLSGDVLGADAILASLIVHVATHAYGTALEPLPPGVADLDEVRGARIAAAMNGGAP